MSTNVLPECFLSQMDDVNQNSKALRKLCKLNPYIKDAVDRVKPTFILPDANIQYYFGLKTAYEEIHTAHCKDDNNDAAYINAVYVGVICSIIEDIYLNDD